ncbi:MAG: prolyl oligopeptidase family serine peptidase [Candidatus Aminicenantes bacterium]|nr:prolyl oligopeptidase family serine peptidase [Candidatus Aminicenantes bacterium]
MNDRRRFKSEFQYLEKVEIFQMTYLSDGLKIKGFLVVPKKEGKYPCIIFNRGGFGELGKIDDKLLFFLLALLSSKGYVIICSQYRGSVGSEGKDEYGGADINDVVNLIPALGYVNKADTSRIGMYGVSRGGMMTYIALTKTKKIKAAVVWAGISDSFNKFVSSVYFPNRILIADGESTNI